ncbi:ThiF family adenylyltransferase [Pectobacterium sp. CFBP8739]|uniref:ThiF family adenylyltransferase n=1 Tax=Pectobacterium sp. CFBP8739 TaxID=2748908 RepID=UPI0015DD6E0A|nr:ThiF family adenylyltransferase [Pectobacterium sp. CFBP8739]MBA0165926.1 ThiF family adenylyltransferase [Pectobacterium sp. CFBP8739]
MNNKKYKIKETVDIFISENELEDTILLTFHIMTTRDRLEIKTNKNVAIFIASLDGEKTIDDIVHSMGNIRLDEVSKLMEFLLNQHLVFDVENKINDDLRFSRQITFWDDFVLDRPGEETQSILESKKIVLFGCGAVGAKIIEILVRAGISTVTLIDYKIVSSSNSVRHCYYSSEYIGKPKVEALSEFLTKINKNIKIHTSFEKLVPNSDLSTLIPDDADLIINTCDEPYIGHTSLKLGRYAQSKNIPFYVAGGFDAHLMSSGELIFPPRTPCIDCAQSTFSKALKGWKPVYSMVESQPSASLTAVQNNHYIPGGPGGLAMMSGFSANLCCMQLLHFLLDDSAFSYNNHRHEYLPNSGLMTQFELVKQDGCKICNG